MKTSHEPNGTKEDLKIGILHSVDNYYVSNEGTKAKPSYHVWIPGITHSTCDSAYSDISLAVFRCNYLHSEIGKNGIFSPIHHTNNYEI